ncbi:MAG: hypothetical protein JJE13_10700 [Thermoleophilia bacterium]|nr:hypothetical protein [Thermoleophilia bacterium]
MLEAVPTDTGPQIRNFEDLYRESRDDLYSYVAGLLRDRIAAEDVTALAFERAYRKWEKFNPNDLNDPELEALAVALRENRPEPEAKFAEKLDTAVADHFPPEWSAGMTNLPKAGFFARLTTRLNKLERRANLTPVGVTVETGGDTSSSDDDSSWGIGDAVDDAGRMLGVSAGVALIALAIAVPIGLMVLIALALNRAWVRRSRQRALDEN